MKHFIRKLLPPIILELCRRKPWNPIYSSYEDAIKHADGYEDDDLTSFVVAKAKRFAGEIASTKELDLMSLRTFIGLATSMGKEKLTVIDFGGGAGAHYFMAKLLLLDSVELDWRVVETSKMVAEAKTQGLETDELHFFDSLETATDTGDINLVFASGSIQYTPKPYDFLSELASINAEVLMITRTPVTNSPCVFVQHAPLFANGPGETPKEMKISNKIVSYPVTMMERSKVETILSCFGEVMLKIAEDKGAYSTTRDTYDMWGYIVRKT